MARFRRRRFRRVLIDVDTQVDNVCKNSRDHSECLRHIRRLMAWSRRNHIPVISTAITRRPAAADDPFVPAPLCVEGTPGQRKIKFTTLHRRICFTSENRFDLPTSILTDYQQVIFEKRTDDPFVQPRADRLLTDLHADQFIVFGIGIETAIKNTVLGLLSRGKSVTVVTDAVDTLGHTDNRRTAILALRKMEAKGAKLIKTATLTGHSTLVAPPNNKPALDPS